MSETKDADEPKVKTEEVVSGDKPDSTIVAEESGGGTGKDDCSDLTDNNAETEESSSKSFPQKLMEILSKEENADIISWLPQGNGFLIHKKKAFANDILPKYFKASKFTSFTRKLNRWGFSRAPRGPETGAYFHKLFGRDKPELVLQMTSNSGNKYPSVPQGQQLLPAVPMMMGPTQMPYYMPPHPQMAMLSPQQQQALWQQQMQLFQFQQMQMMQYQQGAGGGGGTGGGGPRGPPVMMMMQPPPPAAAAPALEDGKATDAATHGDAGADGAEENNAGGTTPEDLPSDSGADAVEPMDPGNVDAVGVDV